MPPRRNRQLKPGRPVPTKSPTLRYDYEDDEDNDNDDDDDDGNDDDDNFSTFEKNDQDAQLRDKKEDESLLKQWDKESVTDIPGSEPVYDTTDTAMENLPPFPAIASSSRNVGAATETKKNPTESGKVTEMLNSDDLKLDNEESPKTDTAKTLTPAAQTPVNETPLNETLASETQLTETLMGEFPLTETLMGETPLAETTVTETLATETLKEENEDHVSKQGSAKLSRKQSSQRSSTTHVSKSTSDERPDGSPRKKSKKAIDETKEDNEENLSKQGSAKLSRKQSSQRSSTTHVSKSASDEQTGGSPRKRSKKSIDETKKDNEEIPSRQDSSKPSRRQSSQRSSSTHLSKSASDEQTDGSPRKRSKKSIDETNEDNEEIPSRQDSSKPSRRQSSQRSSTTHVSESASDEQPVGSPRKKSKKSIDESKEDNEEHLSQQGSTKPSRRQSSHRSSTTRVSKSASEEQPDESASRKSSKKSIDDTKEHPPEHEADQLSRRHSSLNKSVIHIPKSASTENPNGSRSQKNTPEPSEDQGWLPSFLSGLVRRFKEYMAPQQPADGTEAEEEVEEEEAELLVSEDHFLLRSDRQASVNKLDKKLCTVLEFDPIVTPDPRPVEACNLGATVFFRPALRIRVGTHSSPGNIQVDLDYANKRAFLQLLPLKPELNAVYNVKNMNFLRTNSCGCVAWMGSREQLGDCQKRRSSSASAKPANNRRSSTPPETQKRASDRQKTSTPNRDTNPNPLSSPTKTPAVLLDAERTRSSKPAHLSTQRTDEGKERSHRDLSIPPSTSKTKTSGSKSERSRKTSAPSDLSGRGSHHKDGRRHSRERTHSQTSATKKSLSRGQSSSMGAGENNLDPDESEDISPFEESNIVEVLFRSETQAERLLSLVQTLQQGFSPHVVTMTTFVPFEPMDHFCPASAEGHFYVLSDLVDTNDQCPVVDHMDEILDGGWSPGCPLVFKFS